MQDPQAPWSLAARAGLWVGSFSWLAILCLVTLPDTGLLAGPLVGAAAITLAIALSIETIGRAAPRPGLAIAGASWCAVGVIGAYFVWILTPSIQAVPGLSQRLSGKGISVEFPEAFAVIAFLVGAPLLLTGLRQVPDEEARTHA